MKLWILPTATVSPLKPLLEEQLRQRGIVAEVQVAAFGEMEQQVLDPHSPYRTSRPDVTILLPDAHDLLTQVFASPFTCDRGQREAAIDHAVARVSAVAAATATVSAHVLLANGASPTRSALGLLEAEPGLSLRMLTEQYNRRICAAVRGHGNVNVLDYAGLVAEVGYARFHDDRLWTMARMRVSGAGLSQLAIFLARATAALFRRPRKCIVLDLDNTLWGGILGEDGVDGIHVGEDGVGLAFARFQRELLALRARGILLAIASKNDESQALDVLRRHPGMVLRPEHFSAHRIGWQPKVESLIAIAEELGFDTRALVFVDDSAHETEAVRQQLPDVAVIRLPEDPADYVATLWACEELDTLRVTDEDRNRNEMVAVERQRAQLRAETPDLATFLRSLNQEAILEALGEANVARAAQLCQRTNQFNLTLRRHDIAALHRYLADRHVGILLRARDRLGDSGIVGFALAVPRDNATWELDTFVMSCRVIGRGLETVLMAEVVRAVKEKACSELLANYVPGPRNNVCSGLLSQHGFEPRESEHSYRFPTAARQLSPHDFIRIQWSSS